MKKQLAGILAAILVSGGWTIFVHAEEAAVVSPAGVKADAVKEAANQKRETIQKSLEERKTIGIEAIEAIKKAAQEKQAAILKAKEEFKQQIEAKRVETKAKIEAQKEKLKIQLKQIKDERKKQIVEKLDNRFTEINTKLIKHWEENLNRLEGLLSKANSRADKVIANGVDASATKTAIATAETVIENARKMIAVQVAKTYPITISGENKLKSDVSSVRTALNNDLKIVKDAVQAAHKAVVNVIVSLKAIPKVNEMMVPSNNSENTSGASGTSQ